VSPFYFGTSRRRLFGIYHPPASTGRSPRAAVLCNAWGREYVLTHRSLRHLGNLLAAEGHHVLRFDYYGTGDSGGELDEASVEGFEGDVVVAMEELRDMCGLPQVALVGHRLGGTIAARVAARQAREVQRLVLWDPVDRGTAFVDEVMGNVVPGCFGRRARGTVLEELEIRGFPMTPSFLAAVRELDLAATMRDLDTPTLAVISNVAWPAGTLEQRLAGSCGACKVTRVESAPAWVEDEVIGGGAIPLPLLTQAVAWLSQ